MSYRCQICTQCVSQNNPMLRYIQYRLVDKIINGSIVGKRTEIKQETPVCKECNAKLGRGEKPEVAHPRLPLFKYGSDESKVDKPLKIVKGTKYIITKNGIVKE